MISIDGHAPWTEMPSIETMIHMQWRDDVSHCFSFMIRGAQLAVHILRSHYWRGTSNTCVWNEMNDLLDRDYSLIIGEGLSGLA